MGVCEGVSHACMHAHTHACMHTHTCMLNMINMDASMLVAICNFYTCIHVCHVCVYMHMHMHVCEQIKIIQFCLKICDP